MRAIVYRRYGGPEVLVREDRPDPEPASDEVLLRVEAAGVNPIDARLRSGEVRWLLPGGFPRVPGFDVAGVVVRSGAKSTLKEGTRVLAFLDRVYGGAYAELATCTHTSAVAIPDAMPFADAAALPLAGSTALQSLRDHGRLRENGRVLITGASGGVGALAVQIAKARGAHVTGVASGKHEAFVREQGADDFIDYQHADYANANAEWDLVFDAAGKSSFAHAKRVLTANGRYVTTEPSLQSLITAVVTWPMRQHARPMLAMSRMDDLAELVRLYADGKLRVTIDRVFPLEEAADAHGRIEAGGFCGKLVLGVGG